MRKVAVLFGGKSCEHEISVLTGVFVLNLIDREKYLPVPVREGGRVVEGVELLLSKG